MVTAIEEMVTDGQKHITELETAIKDLNSRMEALASEIGEIKKIREDRNQFLTETRQSVLRLENQHNQAAAFAKLAHGRANEGQAVKALAAAKKALDSGKKEQTNLEKDTMQEEAEASTREQELRKQLHLLQSERDTQAAALRRVQLGMDKARNELGQEKHTGILADFQTKQTLIDDLTAQLVAAKADLLSHHETCVQQLQPWPSLQQDIKSLMPADDATTRVLEAEIHFLSTLLEDASQVNASARLPSLKGGFGYIDLWSKVLIPDNEIISAIKRQSPNLQIRRDVLQKLLEEYRTHLTEEHAL